MIGCKNHGLPPWDIFLPVYFNPGVVLKENELDIMI
jgi:hypothetical protein